MKSSLTATVARFLGLLAMVSFAASAHAQVRIAWMNSLSAARPRAAAEGKLLLVDISTSWCGPCRWLEQNTFPHPEIVALSQRFVPVKIDGDSREGQRIVRLYGIRGYPTLLLLKADGTKVDAIVGAMGPEPLAVKLRGVLTHWERRRAGLSVDVPTSGAGNVSVAQRILERVNAERTQRGIAPLRTHPRLDAAAQLHAEDMARFQYFSHTDRNGGSPQDRARSHGYTASCGENIALGASTAQAAMNLWMRSPGHRANILDGHYTELGVGRAQRGGRHYWVQVFGCGQPPRPSEDVGSVAVR
jgi:thiol-disulfide isomerase/thioredoxin